MGFVVEVRAISHCHDGMSSRQPGDHFSYNFRVDYPTEVFEDGKAYRLPPHLISAETGEREVTYHAPKEETAPPADPQGPPATPLTQSDPPGPHESPGATAPSDNPFEGDQADDPTQHPHSDLL